MYPAVLKHTENELAKDMRAVMGWLTILHACLFLFTFAVVGFVSMLLNVLYMSVCYSAYLTLRHRVIYFYYFVLVVGATEGIYAALTSNSTMGSLQILGKMITLVFYGLFIFFAVRAHIPFTKSGGIHG